ncbi:hypothetical protein PVAP13_6NG325301 [Panicum virgatum]|uniref:Uncharacterized protein n=1 Tax=Panicum virgatum TaxID=38727 RepID=A0A8T0R5E4_PANVG|nr:hypothetical protein PVAP13_6NG325301 [Panicum virgatum]
MDGLYRLNLNHFAQKPSIFTEINTQSPPPLPISPPQHCRWCPRPPAPTGRTPARAAGSTSRTCFLASTPIPPPLRVRLLVPDGEASGKSMPEENRKRFPACPLRRPPAPGFVRPCAFLARNEQLRQKQGVWASSSGRRRCAPPPGRALRLTVFGVRLRRTAPYGRPHARPAKSRSNRRRVWAGSAGRLRRSPPSAD